MNDNHPFAEETPIVNYLQPIELKEFSSGIDFVDCIYVINLDERLEKWNRMKRLFDQYALKVNRFRGINGWKLSQEAMKELAGPYPLRLNGGQIGCLLSHVSILKDAYQRGFNQIWVFEDDVMFLSKPQEVHDFLLRLNKLDPEWDIFFTDMDMQSENCEYLRSNIIDPRPNQRLQPQEHFFQNIAFPLENLRQIRIRFGTYSMLLSRRGIEKLLHYFCQNYLWQAIDIDMHYVPGIREYTPLCDMVTNFYDLSSSDTIDRSSLNPEGVEKP